MELASSSEDTPFVDANFDGREDLALSTELCSGNCYFGFWLFDPKTKRFNKHEGLSSLASPALDAQTGQIRSYHGHGAGGQVHTQARYQFVGREITKVWEPEQADDVRAPGKLGGPTDGVFHRTVRAVRQGAMQVLCEAFVRDETNEVLALHPRRSRGLQVLMRVQSKRDTMATPTTRCSATLESASRPGRLGRGSGT